MMSDITLNIVKTKLQLYCKTCWNVDVCIHYPFQLRCQSSHSVFRACNNVQMLFGPVEACPMPVVE